MGIPQIVIGLTVVAMGTSMPEFFVSLMSALHGTSDLAVGNIVGSNIFNTMAIVGIAAVVAPMTISRNTVRKDIPFAVLASALLLMMCYNLEISRWEAAVLFVVFIIFMVYTVRMGMKNGDEQAIEQPPMALWKAVGLLILGLLCLVGGSDLFVNGAKSVAKMLGVSDAVIGLTVVACGTSLPELATSIVAARKGQSAIAIGNVIGSNVFNILMILGITGMVLPMNIQGITTLDLSVMMGSMVLVWLFSYTKYTVERWEGALLTVGFIGYMTWLVVHAV
jgi:cation:H+ antiporter